VETRAAPDEHWQTIERRLDGSPADFANARRHAGRRFSLVLVAALLVAVVGVLVGLAEGGSLVDSATPPIPAGAAGVIQPVFSGACMLAAIVIWVVGLVRTRRRQGFPWSWREPTAGVPRVDRRTIERTLTGRSRPEPDRVPVLRRLAALRLHQSLWAMWLFGGWVLLSLGQASNSWRTWVGTLQLVLAVCWVLMLVLMSVKRRRWRDFIAQHGDPIPGT